MRARVHAPALALASVLKPYNCATPASATPYLAAGRIDVQHTRQGTPLQAAEVLVQLELRLGEEQSREGVAGLRELLQPPKARRLGRCCAKLGGLLGTQLPVERVHRRQRVLGSVVHLARDLELGLPSGPRFRRCTRSVF